MPINRSIHVSQKLYPRKHDKHGTFSSTYNSAAVEQISVPRHLSAIPHLSTFLSDSELEIKRVPDSSIVGNDKDQNLVKAEVDNPIKNIGNNLSTEFDKWSEIQKQQNMELEKMMEKWYQNNKELDRVWDKVIKQWNGKDEEQYEKLTKMIKEKEKIRQIEDEKENKVVKFLVRDFGNQLQERKEAWENRMENQVEKWENMVEEREKRWDTIIEDWENNQYSY
ncbi:hypothetical protein HOY80DRAFT_1137813 [Tuber brumale]|nr:hypothetical protein HOY80DRAFT_1137813 [Tuber brumale]